MPNAIKLFHLLQKFYKSLGLDIQPNRLDLKCSLNLKNIFIFIFPMHLFISSVAFFLFKAQTADEYSVSFFVSITTFFATMNFLTIARKMANILMLIGKYEAFIENSEFEKLNLTRPKPFV